jgi:hypothetical protein
MVKVKDLVSKDFENTNVKKMEARARLNVYRRKTQSLSHQQEIITEKMNALTKKLVEAGLAYTSWDPRFKEGGSYGTHFKGGDFDYMTAWVRDIEETAKYKKIFAAMHARREYIGEQLGQLRRSMKGTRSAMTRKRRWG